MKKSRKDLYYIAKFDLDKMKNEEKKSLFKKKFKLNLDKINSDNNYKIPKKNISIIEEYYTEFMLKKVFNNFNEDERSIYDHLCEEDEEGDNNVIYQIYKDFLKHKNINELKTQLKKIIEEAEKVDVEENEEEDENNKGSFIKEENAENEEEEEEDYEGEEDEENEGDENDDEQDKKDDSSSNNFILKNDDKDATAKVLNNNYKKNYHFSNFANSNNKNNEVKSKSKEKENSANENEERKNNEEENNLGLNFVVIKPKKINKEEEKKDQGSNYQNNNFNLYSNKQKENSVSTSNNPNKKLTAFISQIEHIKKIDEIKQPIIEAINRNNKYIMELYEKFQKNKSILNKKSLYDVFNKIKANPDSGNGNTGENNKKFSSFKALIQENDELNEEQKEFLCYDFMNNKSSYFIEAFNAYEDLKDKDEFFETILFLMKNRNSKESYVQFCVKKMKESGNYDIIKNSKEIINLMKKKELFSDKDCEIMENYLGNDDGVFLGIFRELFKTGNIKDFIETMNLALASKKDGNSKAGKSKWDNELIKKSDEELKKNMEEKYYNSLMELYKKKSEKLFNILESLNSSNLNAKIQAATVLVLKKDLSPT